jgi:RecJ-like exonuclease
MKIDILRIKCPCCDGSGKLELWDASRWRPVKHGRLYSGTPDEVMCCHCSGKGYVEQEAERLGSKEPMEDDDHEKTEQLH